MENMQSQVLVQLWMKFVNEWHLDRYACEVLEKAYQIESHLLDPFHLRMLLDVVFVLMTMATIKLKTKSEKILFIKTK